MSRFDQLRDEPGARELLCFGGEAADEFEPNRLVLDSRVCRPADAGLSTGEFVHSVLFALILLFVFLRAGAQ